MLYSAAIWIEVHVAKRLCSSQTPKNEGFPIGMDDVHELGVGTVQASSGVLELEEWTGWV